MKIKSIETYKMSLPLKVPFRTALRVVESMESIVVKVQTDTGHIGWGEAPATAVITGDTLPSIAYAIESVIGPQLIGQDVSQLEELMHIIQTSMAHNTSPKAALDMAVYDLFAQRQNTPLYKLLGGYTNTIETDITISLNPVDVMIEDSLRAVAAGYHILKIKVGSSYHDDVDRIIKISDELPDDIKIRIDANQGWSPKTAVRVIKTLEELGVEMELVEQPVKADDIEGLDLVTKSVDTPILADEAVFSMRDAKRLLDIRAADFINIKLMKTGGIHSAIDICSLALSHLIPCMMGCMLEGGIAATAAAHFACAKRNIIYVDIDGPLLASTNPVKGGAVFGQPYIQLSEAAGLGIEDVEGLVRYKVG